MKESTVGLIPARLESSRLPRKALADICGLPMIVHVYRRTCLAQELDDVYVVTDSDEIEQTMKKHGGKTIRTRSDHQTGSDRIAEAARNLTHDIVVNIQGDEALVDPDQIDTAVRAFTKRPDVNVAILVIPYFKRDSPSDIKVVVNQKNEIMYLSREDIPSNSRTADAPLLKAYHIVPFRREFLIQYASWEKGKLESIEYNEYLRILERGHKILSIPVESDAISVDTDEDLAFVRNQMPQDPFYTSVMNPT